MPSDETSSAQSDHRRSSEAAAAHAHLLGADPGLAIHVAVHGPIDPYARPRIPLRDGDLLGGLVFHVVSQRISEAAALAVFARLRAALGGTIDARALGATPLARLRAAGLSGAKARALNELAGRVVAGEPDLDKLAELGDEDVVRRLAALPGIGPWSARIFLLYELRRPDVFPDADRWLRVAIARLDALDIAPGPSAATRRAEAWRPYRSYAAAHLWRSLGEPSAAVGHSVSKQP